MGEDAVGKVEAAGVGAFGMVDHFFAQEGAEVEAGRAVGVAFTLQLPSDITLIYATKY